MEKEVKTRNLITAIAIVLLLTLVAVSLSGLYARVTKLENREPVIREVTEPTTIVQEGAEGVQGLRGEKGEKGEMPDGHWENYCLYYKDVAGYPTKGVMIRKSVGDCKEEWRTVQIWEK